MASTAAAEGGRSTPKGAPRSGTKGIKRELFGLVLVGLGLMVCLALWSYHPADPSLNTTGSGRVRNWIGPIGAATADLAHQFLGLGAYLVAWIPAAFGFAVLLGQRM